MCLSHTFRCWVLLGICAAAVIAQEPKVPAYTQVKITLTSEGGPSDCYYVQDGRHVDCMPKYSATVDEQGTVSYNGTSGVKTRGERVHSVPIATVRNLVSEFYRIDFFSLQDRYEVKKLPNNVVESIDHGNAVTIAIDIDGKSKSVYVFYGAPEELTNVIRKVINEMKISQYVGRT